VASTVDHRDIDRDVASMHHIQTMTPTTKTAERHAAPTLGWSRPRGHDGTAPKLLEAVGELHVADAAKLALEKLVGRQLELLGEDPDRQGLQKTPERVANSLLWLTAGYGQSVADVVGDAVFEEAHENMVMVRDIELYSMCEHHMLPFFGRAHIAYIPDGRIVGLSKLPRIVEVFARRLQVQERLTEQVAQAIEDILQPRGVGVVIEAVHLCMMMRGVEKQNSSTITSALRGQFRECPMTRDEFLRLAHRNG
jgi:GTP cyclohydrolase IA